MDNTDFRDKLTKSAVEALQQAVRDYEHELIKEAFSFAVQNHTADKEISLNDIQEAIKSLQKRKGDKAVLEEGLNENLKEGLERFYISKEKRKQRTTQLMIFSLAAVGLTYMFLGVFFYLDDVSSFRFRSGPGYLMTTMGLVTALTSVFIGLYYKYYTNVREERKNESKRMNDLIIKLWSQIDYYGKALMGPFVSKSISKEISTEVIGNSHLDLINHLLGTTEEQEKFSKLLQVRNKIVHGGSDVRLHISEQEEAITIANEIINHLEIIVKNEIPNAAIE